MSEVKAKGKREAKQQEMLEVPQDEAAKAAENYLEWVDERGRIAENLTLAELHLIEEMKKASRESVTIQGIKLTIKYQEAAERISVRKAKKEKIRQ